MDILIGYSYQTRQDRDIILVRDANITSNWVKPELNIISIHNIMPISNSLSNSQGNAFLNKCLPAMHTFGETPDLLKREAHVDTV